MPILRNSKSRENQRENQKPEAPLPWLSSFPIFFRSGKNLFGSFIPFGHRLKSSSEKGQNTQKKRGTRTWH